MRDEGTVAMKPSALSYDPEYVQSLRELAVILLLFAACFAWTICVSAFAGYGSAHSNSSQPSGVASESLDFGDLPESLPATSIILGMPSWVFWGIFMPWLIIDIVVVWFCFRFMQSSSFSYGVEPSPMTPGEPAASAGVGNEQ